MNFFIVQFFNFIVAIGIGIIVGLLFDIYRGLGKKCRPSSRSMPLWDIFWWIMVTSLVFFILLNLNWAEIRLYIFLGGLIGFVFYYKKISPYFLKRFIGFLFWLEKTIKKIVRLILIPIRVIKRIILIPVMAVALFCHKTAQLFKKAVWVVKLIFRTIPRKCKIILKNFLKNSRNKK